MSQLRIRLHDDVVNRVREIAHASQTSAAMIVNEVLRHSLNGQNGTLAVDVHHVHDAKPNPEFRAKLIKGQRGSYGFELTVADADLSTVLTQIDRFEEAMLKRYGDEDEQRALKVRKEIEDLYGS
jgi:hypothetical protein